MQAYTKLEKIFKKIGDVEGASAILHWDSSTMMPKGSGESRINQLSTLQTICHNMITAPEVSDLLDEAESNKKDLDGWQEANLKLMRHSWKHSNALSEDLVEELSKAGSQCELVWRTARKEDNFNQFANYLKKVLDLSREAAKIKSEVLDCSPYDALLDQYDHDRKSADVDKIFAELESFLPTFTQNVIEQQSRQFEFFKLDGPFPVEQQKELGRGFMSLFGFNFNQGRIDESLHPCCGGVPDDIRITTRYDDEDFMSGFMGVLHETGHALYEAGLPEKWRGQPVGEALGMTMHESQSLLIEMQVSRSRNFLIYAAPIIASAFGKEGVQWGAENLHRLYNKVNPGLIRVDADEVTYPSHIILRYRIEKDLIEGNMEVEDIPEAWNNYMKELLGVTVPNNRDGCMQDIHWADGSFGYFPTYTLGAMHAAQIFNAAKKDDHIIDGIKKGDYMPLRDWLREKIHSQGSRYSSDELLKNVTGETLNVDIYKNHLRNRYLA